MTEEKRQISPAALAARRRNMAIATAARKANAVGDMFSLKVPPGLLKKIADLAEQEGVARWKIVDAAIDKKIRNSLRRKNHE